jgi:hypothetical protein
LGDERDASYSERVVSDYKRPPTDGRSAYERAKSTYNKFSNTAVQMVLVVLLAVLFLIKGPTLFPASQSGAWEIVLGGLAIIVALLAMPAASVSAKMMLLQMEQAEENRRSDIALADAMSKLTKELRRRREIPASLTIALFGTAENRDAAGIAADGDE